jgi:alkanesulfonate monooxygenase SsuD/methylene tetrahydromethanopterin reductase-like flavin-dependent oxidoreductase (luciferase family)
VTDFEARGIPAVGVATTEFVEAWRAQSEALGFESAMIFVPHPIQDRTDDEIRDLADAALDRILAELGAKA